MRLGFHAGPGSRPAARRAAGRQAGAVIVEFAMVALFIATLSAGAYDYGMDWRSSLAVNEAARAGARVGSSQGKKVDADHALLTSLRSTLAASGLLEEVERVVIFPAATSGTVPSTCTAAVPSGTCTVLSGANLAALPDTATTTSRDATTGCIATAYSLRRTYCPTNRSDQSTTADYVGVYVRIRQLHVFKLVGTAMTIERTAVMRVEPPEN